MIELYNNLTIEQLNTIFKKNKRSTYLLKCLYLSALLDIFLFFSKGLNLFSLDLVFADILVLLTLVFSLFALYKECAILYSKEKLYKETVSNTLIKTQFTKNKIIFFYKDYITSLTIDQNTDTSRFTLNKQPDIIFITINNILIATKNSISEEQYNQLSNLFEQYKNNYRPTIINKEDYLYECPLFNSFFLHMLFFVYNKIKPLSNYSYIDIIMLVLSAIDLLTLQLNLYTYFIIRITVFMIYAINNSCFRYKAMKNIGYINKTTSIKFTESDYAIAYNGKYVSHSPLNQMIKVSKLNHFYYIQTLTDVLFIKEKDYTRLKNIIHNDFVQ